MFSMSYKSSLFCQALDIYKEREGRIIRFLGIGLDCKSPLVMSKYY